MNEEEAIKVLNIAIGKTQGVHIYQDTLRKAIDTVLNLIEKQQAEIEKKDKTVKHIIERLENDIKRITETKTKKSEHYLDDYTRNRLKAYKTKTKEIKEYIEEQYFNQKIEKGE